MDLTHSYAVPDPTVPSQQAMVTSRAVVRPKYAIIPASVLINYSTYSLPFWRNTHTWVLCSPAMGHGCTFTEYLLFVDPGGGSEKPEIEDGVESFLFVLDGELDLFVNKKHHNLVNGSFAFLPDNHKWRVDNHSDQITKFLWVRKMFEPLEDLHPAIIIGNEREIPEVELEASDNKITTQYLIPPGDISYDMQMNINNWEPGSIISVSETHIMEHGLYMLQGAGVYLLNQDWLEVQPGDFIWMAPFCPQSFYCGGPIPARYILYKNMNRQVSLTNGRPV